MLKFCDDLRNGVESLLLLGIGINPDKSEASEFNKGKCQSLKDFIERKLYAKIELDPHVLSTKLDPKSCRILTNNL